MTEFNSGDRYEINDGKEPIQIVTVIHNYGTKVITEIAINEGYKEFKKRGETHRDTFQQLIDNGYLQKL